ncbi:uncharacterized protein LOC144095686 [Amblyomma americanum]
METAEWLCRELTVELGDVGFVFAGGQRLTLRFVAQYTQAENIPPVTQPPAPVCASDAFNGVGPGAFPAASASADEAAEIWSTRKTKFISKYTEMKDLVGKSRELRKRKLLWVRLTDPINKEFMCSMTTTQIKNKWKSLDRAYKRTKEDNSSSGDYRVSGEYEEELAEILEKEHSINPRLLLEPGKAILLSGCSGTSTTEASAELLLVPVEDRLSATVEDSPAS